VEQQTDEWVGLQATIASRLPYVRWLQARDKLRSAEIDYLRETLPVLAELVWQPWYPVLERAKQEIWANASTTGFSETFRSEEVLYWLHIPGWIAAWAETEKPSRTLDIGAGYGTLAVFVSALTGSTVHCLDFESDRIARSTADRYALRMATSNIEQTDVPWTDLMDAVVMTEVLEHFNFHPVPTMRKIAGSLRPGGRLFLSTPDAESWGKVEGSYATYQDLPLPDPLRAIEDRHVYQFNETELRDVLKDSGFRLLRLERSPGRWGLHFNVEATPD